MRLRQHGLAAAVIGVACFGIVHAANAPYLWWKIEVRDALKAVEGLTFDLFGSRPQIDFVITFSNEETDQGIFVPAEFVANLRLSMSMGDTAVPIKVDWKTLELVTPSAEVPLSVGQPFTVEAGDRFDLTGSLRRDGGPPFAEVNHKLKVLVEQAVLTLRLKDRTTPWKGRFEPEGDLLLRFTPPVTVSDKRLSKLLEGRRALDRNDNAAALGHFGELLKLDPGDEGARAGIGEAYLNLGRFSEAAREFEALLPSVRETKSSICFSLAYAYVALADQQKAESTLRLVVPADQISRVIENIREDLKKRRR